MAQSTLEDDELFDEASDEMREDVETALEKARDGLPDADEVLEVEADNLVGVLNGINSGLKEGDAEDGLREAKKWFGIGKKADVFEEDFLEEAQEELEDLEDTLESLSEVEETATELTGTVAGLKDVL
jgi:hypothetical protein